MNSALLPSTTTLQNSVNKELSQRDKSVRVQCWQTAFDMAQDDPDFINSLLISEEAKCFVKGFVNKQHFRCWTPKIPREIHESEKIVVWCAVGAVGVIEPYFV